MDSDQLECALGQVWLGSPSRVVLHFSRGSSACNPYVNVHY